MEEPENSAMESKRIEGQNMAIDGIIMSNFGDVNSDLIEATLQELSIEETKNRIIRLRQRKFFLLAGAAAAAIALLFLSLNTTIGQYKSEIARLESEKTSLAKAHQTELSGILLSNSQERAELQGEINTLKSRFEYLAYLNSEQKEIPIDLFKGIYDLNEEQLSSSGNPASILSNKLFDQIRTIDPVDLISRPQSLAYGESVETDQSAKILNIGSFATIQAAPNSKIENVGSSEQEHLLLTKGSVFCNVTSGAGEFSIETSLGTVRVTGTKFEVALELKGDQKVMRIHVKEGSVICTEKSGAVVKLDAGMTHVVS
ncbi:MAG: FecR domain-containing protein [Verrucomicrobiota bacterium]